MRRRKENFLNVSSRIHKNKNNGIRIRMGLETGGTFLSLLFHLSYTNLRFSRKDISRSEGKEEREEKLEPRDSDEFTICSTIALFIPIAKILQDRKNCTTFFLLTLPSLIVSPRFLTSLFRFHLIFRRV